MRKKLIYVNEDKNSGNLLPEKAGVKGLTE